MTDRRLASVGVALMALSALVVVAGSTAGLTAVAPHRGAEAAVVTDPGGYIGVTPDADPEACLAVVGLTNYFDAPLTDVAAVVKDGPGTVASVPGGLNSGESGAVTVAVESYDPTTVWVRIDADGPDRRVTLHRNVSIDCIEPVEPATQGYWATHPEEWPTETVTVGGVTYSQNEALALLVAGSNGSPVAGDVTRQLFSQTVAATLNVAAGADECVAPTIDAADDWLAAHPPGSGVAGDSHAWTDEGEPIKDALNAYNNGARCP
jgi:hypothetical protein